MDSILVLIAIVGLVQLPLLVDFLHHALPTSPLPRLASRVTRPIFVTLSFGCCLFALYQFFAVFLPISLHHWSVTMPMVGDRWSMIHRVLAASLSALAVMIVFNLGYHYTACSFGPASPEPPLSVHAADIVNGARDPDRSMCVQCLRVRTYRIHHCRVCNRCVQLFDHHCPFTANCVGASNLRAFWLWLTFAVVGLMYSCTMSWTAFNACILQRSSLPQRSTSNVTFEQSLSFLYGDTHQDSSSGSARANGDSGVFWSVSYCRSLSNAPWVFLLVGFGLLTVGALWLFETWLLHTDKTTVEFVIGLGKKARVHKDDDASVVVHGSDDSDDEYSLKIGANGIVKDVEFAATTAPMRRRKSWSLIHRHEPLYRALMPDALWRFVNVLASKPVKVQ